jgi:hypothetical protein
MPDTLIRTQLSSQVQFHDRVFHEHGGITVNSIDVALHYATLILKIAFWRKRQLGLLLPKHFAL